MASQAPARQTFQPSAAWGHREIGHGPFGRRLGPLPAELAFLSAYGAPPALLVEAAATARREGVTPDAALLAMRGMTELFYYRSLARHLGVHFIDGAVMLGAGARYPQSIHAGIAPLAGDGPRWLVAPRGEMLASLLRAKQSGESMRDGGLAITTPAHLSRLIRQAAAPAIAHAASLALAEHDPELSAKSGASAAQCVTAAAILATLGIVCALVPDFGLPALTIATGLMFLAALCLRLFAGAASLEGASARAEPVDDRLLPAYSIVVALHREARVVRQLARALEAIDYPH